MAISASATSRRVGSLADPACGSVTVAADEILRPQTLAIGHLDVDAGVVLCEPSHLACAVDRHRQLTDPVGKDALDMVLPQAEHVIVPGGKVADVQGDVEVHHLVHLSLREEALGDSALIEDLDRA
jgi:hypothetical protein